MSIDQRFWLLAGAYTAFQVSNSMFSAPYYSIIPELVPHSQRGSAGGWVAFLQAAAGLLAGLLASEAGNGKLSSGGVYSLLVALNVLGLLIGLLAFSARPGWCEPEAPPPLAPAPKAATAASGSRNRSSVDMSSLCRAFTHSPFVAMFFFCLMQGLPGATITYFLQYFLQDVIGVSAQGYTLLPHCESQHQQQHQHQHAPAASGESWACRQVGTFQPQSAVSATALVNIATSIAFLGTSLVGGYASDRVGKKPVPSTPQLRVIVRHCDVYV